MEGKEGREGREGIVAGEVEVPRSSPWLARACVVAGRDRCMAYDRGFARVSDTHLPAFPPLAIQEHRGPVLGRADGVVPERLAGAAAYLQHRAAGLRLAPPRRHLAVHHHLGRQRIRQDRGGQEDSCLPRERLLEAGHLPARRLGGSADSHGPAPQRERAPGGLRMRQDHQQRQLEPLRQVHRDPV
eukprot:scaffold5143_cov231-Pinguiococcus_pyrenoidosus.AAC.9